MKNEKHEKIELMHYQLITIPIPPNQLIAYDRLAKIDIQ